MTLHGHTPIFKKDPTDTEFTTGKAVFISFMTIINIFMFFGNTLSIITITTNKGLRRHVSYWFVLNLAIVDFLISVTVIPLNTVWEYYGTWPLSSAGCEIFTFADISFSTISAYSIVLVSIDKYVYITYPMQYFDKMTRKVAIILIIGIWILVIIFTIISVTTEIGTEEEFRNHFYALTNSTNTCIFVMTDAYVIPSAIICFFIPLAILCFTSSKIICIASNHIRKINEVAICIPSDTNSELRHALSVKYLTPRVTNIQTLTPANLTNESVTRIDLPIPKVTNIQTLTPANLTNESMTRTDLPSPRAMNIQTLTPANLTNESITRTDLPKSTDRQIQRELIVTDKQLNVHTSNGCIRQLVDQTKYGGETNPAFEKPDGKIDHDENKLSEDLQRERTISVQDDTHITTENKHMTKLCTSSNMNTSESKNSLRKSKFKQTESARAVSGKRYPYCKLFGTITIVIACFVIMFSPYYIATMLDVGCHCVEPWVYEDILSVLYYMHSLVNPYIYMSTDRKYKAALKSLIRKVKKMTHIT